MSAPTKGFVQNHLKALPSLNGSTRFQGRIDSIRLASDDQPETKTFNADTVQQAMHGARHAKFAELFEQFSSGERFQQIEVGRRSQVPVR